MNNRPYFIFAASIIVAAALLACGWLVRDGLLAVSIQVRDKQVSPLPAEIRLGVGNPDIKVTFGSIKLDSWTLDRTSGASASGTLSIDDIKVELPASQPAAGGR